MALSKDPGLGSNHEHQIKRLINEDGSYNVVRHGGLKGFKDFYKLLIDISWWKFIFFSLTIYILINLLFACIYVLFGTENIADSNTELVPFLKAFFFSVQTLTTVGYGALHPSGTAINVVAAIEAFVGLMSTALITGVLYGRFSKPSSKILFSDNAIITSYKDGNALMFKLVNKRNSILLNASVKVILSKDNTPTNSNLRKEYHQIDLQIDKIHFFPLTWTIVHEIDENSPFYNLSVTDLKKLNAELIILVEAFDETHSQNVIERNSYAENQWKEGVKFAKSFYTNEKGIIELNINDLNNLLPID